MPLPVFEVYCRVCCKVVAIAHSPGEARRRVRAHLKTRVGLKSFRGHRDHLSIRNPNQLEPSPEPAPSGGSAEGLPPNMPPETQPVNPPPSTPVPSGGTPDALAGATKAWHAVYGPK